MGPVHAATTRLRKASQRVDYTVGGVAARLRRLVEQGFPEPEVGEGRAGRNIAATVAG